jgi:hypothetical protein
MDPRRSAGHIVIGFFRIFATMIKTQEKLTHKEAVKKALEMLGGKALLKQIYPVAIKLIGKNTNSVDIKATIRRVLNSNPLDFKATPGMKGSWELISFQEEIAIRDCRIAELTTLLSAKDEMISELKQQETVDHFVGRIVDASKTIFATKRNDARPVQQVLVVMNRPEQQNLMEWILWKPTNVVNKTITKKIIQKTINKGNTYVDHQTIIPNVGNYKPQITTQNIEAPMPSISQQQEPKQLEDEQGRR